jgi:hypothetical protein
MKWLFVQVANQIARRIDLLCALLDPKLKGAEVRAIGGMEPLEGESRLAR